MEKMFHFLAKADCGAELVCVAANVNAAKAAAIETFKWKGRVFSSIKPL